MNIFWRWRPHSKSGRPCKTSVARTGFHRAGAQSIFSPSVLTTEEIESTVADTADDPEIALEKRNRGEVLRQALSSPVVRAS
jgi:hypothetical protein